MRSMDVTIDSGGTTLAGTLTLPPGPGPHPAVLLLAGSGPLDRDGNVKRMPLNVSRDLATLLAEHGWTTLRYDKRGIGASGGEYLSTGFYAELDDADAALRWLLAQPQVSSVVPVGHSVGATFAAELAVRHDTVAGAVLIAATAQTGERTLTWQAEQIAPTLPRFVRAALRLLRTDVAGQQRKAIAKLRTTTTDVARLQGTKVNARWMREFIAYDPVPTLRQVTVPVLAMTGSKDVQVNPDDLVTIEQAVPAAQTQLLPDVDHILRHEPAPVSSVRHYKRQLRQAIDPSVTEPLVDWLARLLETDPRLREADRAQIDQGVADDSSVHGTA